MSLPSLSLFLTCLKSPRSRLVFSHRCRRSLLRLLPLEGRTRGLRRALRRRRSRPLSATARRVATGRVSPTAVLRGFLPIRLPVLRRVFQSRNSLILPKRRQMTSGRLDPGLIVPRRVHLSAGRRTAASQLSLPTRRSQSRRTTRPRRPVLTVIRSVSSR